jgi:hypothetical protein
MRYTMMFDLAWCWSFLPAYINDAFQSPASSHLWPSTKSWAFASPKDRDICVTRGKNY